MDKIELAKLCDARETLCGFCQADECEKCIVTRLIDDAFAECPDDDEECIEEIDEDVLSYIADHYSDPLDFIYAIMNEAHLTDEMALNYLRDSFGYKYSEDELKEVIAQYREERQ